MMDCGACRAAGEINMKTWIKLIMTSCALTWAGFGCGERSQAASRQTEQPATSAIVALDDTNFAASIKDGVVLVDFFATWCGPCRMQGPIVGQVAEQLKGRAVVGRLDVDAAPSTAQKYGINGIPALIIFQNGVPVKQFVGVTEADTLVATITAALGDAPSTRK